MTAKAKQRQGGTVDKWITLRHWYLSVKSEEGPDFRNMTKILKRCLQGDPDTFNLKGLAISYLANERSVLKEQDRNMYISLSPEILQTLK